MFCAQCGRTLADTVRFCDGCGAPTGVGAAAIADIPYAAPPPISHQLTEEVRARSLDAWKGLKLLARNPVGGLSESFSMLGERQAIQVGIVFAIVFEVAVYFGLSKLANDAMGMLGPFGGMLMGSQTSLSGLTAAQAVKAIILGLIPFASLAGAIALARMVFGGKGQLAGDVYTAGASILPMGFFILLGSLLGAANVEVIIGLFMFALTYTVLILYAGCSRIAGIPEVGSAPAVPVVLLLSAWLTKIIVVAMW